MKPRHFIAALIFGFLAYPLSAGPIGALYTHSGIRSTAIIGFYDPIFYVIAKMPTPVRAGYVFYLKACGVDLKEFAVY